MDTDESQLFALARDGDRCALALLIERYLPRLHAYVRVRLGPRVRAREASIDVVQSVCGEVLAGLAKFEFRGEERFRDWLFTAALNKVRDKNRYHDRAKRDAARECDDGSLPFLASYLTPSVDAIGAETGRKLTEALDELSEEHREVITLARIVQLPHAVIAESMGRSEPAVRQLLARALLQLSHRLKQRGVFLP